MSKPKNKAFYLTLFLLTVLLTVIIYKVNDFMSASLTVPQTVDSETMQYIDSAEENSFNVLLLGTDAGGYLTDTIMLVNVDKSKKCISMLSIPRDTKVKVKGKSCKINSCYAKGGLDLLLEKVNDLTDVSVNYYAIINPGTLAKIVDCLGGVEYEVERDMYYSDPSQNLLIDLKAGMQTLDGNAAEQYCRYRSYTMGDLDRTKAQQRFFKALFEQKLKIKYTLKLHELYNILVANVVTNVTFGDIADNISVMSMLENSENINCISTPGEFNDVKKDGTSYYIIDDENRDELQAICIEYFNNKK